MLSTDAGGQEDIPATLQESLDSEQSHVDPASLHRAIGQVFQKFLESRAISTPEITQEQYNSLRDQMIQAFTQAQLQHYLVARLPSNHPIRKGIDGNMKRCMKSRLFLLSGIFTDVWGLVIPIDARNAVSGAGKYNYITDGATFEQLLTDPMQPLITIAKEKNVTINAFRQERRLEISGTPHAAKAAKKAIDKFHKDVLQPIVINFSTKRRSIFTDPSMRGAMNAFLKRIEEKYHVHIAMSRFTIKIVHRGMLNAAKQAADEIRSATELRKEIHRIHIWQPRTSNQMALERHPPPPEFQRGISQLPWSRLVATDIESSIPNPSPTRLYSTSEATVIIQKLTALFDSNNALSGSSVRGKIRSEVTASIGQALFQTKPKPLVAESPLKRTLSNIDGQCTELLADDEDSFDSTLPNHVNIDDLEVLEHKTAYNNGESYEENYSNELVTIQGPEELEAELESLDDYGMGDIFAQPSDTPSNPERKWEQQRAVNQLKSTAAPVFTSDLPFRQHQLVNLDPWKELAPSKYPEIVPSPARRIYRLVFACVKFDESTTWPLFEAYASSTFAAHDAEAPKLTVLRVSAIHAEKSLYALFPERQLDLRFTQQIKHDLVYPNKNSLDAHAPTLHAIENCLKGAKLVDGSKWVLESPLNISVNFTMRNFSEMSRPSISGKGEQSEAANEQRKTIPRVEYYLRSIETIEADSHSLQVPTPPHGSEAATLSLDNITLSGSDMMRQELRLSDRPLFAAPSLKKLDLTTLVNGAMALKEHLSRDSMESILPTQIQSYVRSQNKWREDLPASKRPSTLAHGPKQTKRGDNSVHENVSGPTSTKTEQPPPNSRGADPKHSTSKGKSNTSAKSKKASKAKLINHLGTEEPWNSDPSQENAPTASLKQPDSTSISHDSTPHAKSAPTAGGAKAKAKPKVNAKVKAK